MATLQLFFQLGRAKDLSAPMYVNIFVLDVHITFFCAAVVMYLQYS